jgi:uncharacterized damage-inducible protein DinB
MLAYFGMMAAYNDWANRRLYDACAHLEDDDLRAGLGAFFGSLHGTLNHMLVADRIWMARFLGEPTPDAQLDSILHEGFTDLRKARERQDAEIAAFVGDLDEGALQREVDYTTMVRPGNVRQPLWAALAHVFNHQTHHRGQCHAMLTRIAMEAPSFDLIQFQRDTGHGLSV